MAQQAIIERRRIEAMILSHVHKILTDRIGKSEADSVVGETCSRSAIEQGKALAAELGREPDLNDFAGILPRWTAEDALQIDLLNNDAETMEFNVTRCRYAEMYQEMGLGEIGHLLSCNRDGEFCVGYNPRIKLKRTQTIMSGASFCDFRFSLSDEK